VRVLLDTCVISELWREAYEPRVRDSLDRIVNDDMFLSVITLGELTKGIALLPGSNRRRSLQHWLDMMEQEHAERIVPIGDDIARIWGEITAATQSQGHSLAATDGLIASTALHHELHVVTRNVAEFTGTGVTVLNPWVT
jgi:predicted nucleic acid-binding protein